MPGVFICYRRDDTAIAAGRLYDALAHRFGQGLVFMDVEDAPPARDVLDVIPETLNAGSVVLVLIGRQWLAAGSDGQPRLASPDDPVRQEIVGALGRPDIRTIPVLVDDARLPPAAQLPDDLERLTRLDAAELRHASFRTDVERLIARLEPALDAPGQPHGAAPPLIDPDGQPRPTGIGEPRSRPGTGPSSQRIVGWIAFALVAAAAVVGPGNVVSGVRELVAPTTPTLVPIFEPAPTARPPATASPATPRTTPRLPAASPTSVPPAIASPAARPAP